MFRLFSARASFVLTPLDDVEITLFEMLCQQNMMDAARALIDIDYDEISTYVTAGSPLVVRWGSGERTDSFIGYVHSFRPKTEGYVRRTELLLISAAYPMFNESGVTYYSVGIHNVAQEIGDRYRFQVETDPHPFTHSQILQKDDSDWGLLQRLAMQWGYILQMDGVTLIFRPQKDVLEENYRFKARNRTYTSISTPGADLISFETTYTGKPLANVTFQGVDPFVVTPIRQIGEVEKSIFEEVSAQRSITSDTEAELKSLAIEAEKRFPFTAKAVMRQPFRKRPWDTYRISHDGRPMTWVVKSIKHIVGGTDYQAEIELGSDGNDYIGSLPDNRLDIPTLLKRSKRARRPTPVIINSRPYYLGTGANAVISDQRWKARLMTIPVSEAS